MAKMKDIVPIIVSSIEKGLEFELPVKGTSMLPLFNQDNTTVFLIKSLEYKKNDIVLYKRNDGHYVLHRIFKKKKDSYNMLGDHQVSVEEGILESQIICKVTKYKKNKKLYTMSGLRYKFYVLLWRSVFIRKIYFKVKK